MLGCSSKMVDEVVRGELGWGTMEGRREVLKLRFFGRLVRMQRCRVVRFTAPQVAVDNARGLRRRKTLLNGPGAHLFDACCEIGLKLE